MRAPRAPARFKGGTMAAPVKDNIGYDDGIPSVIATFERPVPNGTRLC